AILILKPVFDELIELLPLRAFMALPVLLLLPPLLCLATFFLLPLTLGASRLLIERSADQIFDEDVQRIFKAALLPISRRLCHRIFVANPESQFAARFQHIRIHRHALPPLPMFILCQLSNRLSAV